LYLCFFKKEEERNKDERIAYESKQRDRQGGGGFRHMYTTRPSQEKKVNMQDKRISAAAASNNAGNSTSHRPRSLKHLTNNDNNPKLGSGSSSFFNKNQPGDDRHEDSPAETAKNDEDWKLVQRGGGSGGNSGPGPSAV